MSEAHEIAAFLRSFLARRQAALSVYSWHLVVRPNFTYPLPTSEDLMREILADPEFAALRLADWLNSPDGEVIASAVAMVIPAPYSAEYRLAVDALTLVAREQQRLGRQKAAALALGVVVVAGLIGLGGSPSPSA